MPLRSQVCLGILAGGRGTRLGGADKAFVELHGKSLVARTLDAMGAGYARTLLAYNGDDARAGRLQAGVVRDLRPDFPGPLAGLETLLSATAEPWLLTVPVDLRYIPTDLPDRMLSRDVGQVVRDDDGAQPLVALWPVREALAAVTAALDAGELAVHPVAARLGLSILDISPARLGNLNTPADFE